MYVYYILLFLAALIFSLQFLITKRYERKNGTGFLSSVRLSLFAYLTIALFFFVKGCITYRTLNFGFSWFTFALTLLIALVSLSCAYMGIKVLSVGNMGIYSVFMMLGSLVLPSLVGVVFYHEKMTLLKAAALLCMFLAIVFSVSGADKKKFSGKAMLYYIGIFIMNGLIGVFFTVHQNKAEQTAAAIRMADGTYAVNNDVFMTWYGLSTVIVCLLIYAAYFIYRAIRRRGDKAGEPPKTPQAETSAVKTSTAAVWLVSIALAFCYGICNGLGDYFIALGTQPGALGSSVSFPIVNGGTILFSTLSGVIFYKEKIRGWTIVSLVLVFVSTGLFLFV